VARCVSNAAASSGSRMSSTYPARSGCTWSGLDTAGLQCCLQGFERVKRARLHRSQRQTEALRTLHLGEAGDVREVEHFAVRGRQRIEAGAHGEADDDAIDGVARLLTVAGVGL